MLPISDLKMRLGDMVDVEFAGTGAFRGEVVAVRGASFDVHFPCDDTK